MFNVRLILSLVVLLQGSLMADALAVPAPLQVRPGRIASPVASGTMIGGQSRDEFTLIGVRGEMIEGADGERLVLTYGDRFGKPLRGEPGYFHVSVDRDSRRVVIDLAQIKKTAVDPSKLARILATSKFVSSSEMTMDPYDGSTNITLVMKSPVRIRATPVGSDQARLVIEMQPAGGR